MLYGRIFTELQLRKKLFLHLFSRLSELDISISDFHGIMLS
jgi:hypothetical protein